MISNSIDQTSQSGLRVKRLAALAISGDLILILFLGFLCGCSQYPLYKDSRLLMGTIVEVSSPNQRAADIAFQEIERIETLLSYYKQDSEVSRLNKQGRLRVSPEALYVIKKADEFWRATQGAFDVAVAPLMELWGFYHQDYRVPDDFEIEEIRELIGFDKLKIDGSIIEFEIEGMSIDLGAIAKGFAIDCAVKKLRLAGINSALLNAGGDIYCLGDKQGIPWRVGIKSGRSPDCSGYLELEDKAVATSGDYEQFFIVNNIRYCHILNPKTGRPAESGIKSVSVVAEDCLTADALATSIFVLGKEKGRELAKRFNAEVRIIEDVQNNE